MPCVVPTCGASIGSFKLFPQHVSLAKRWLEAIQVGCGVKVADSLSDPKEICHWHFGPSTGEMYQEPTVFFDCTARKKEIESCRLCLKFYPISDLVSMDGNLSGNNIKGIIHEFLQIDFRPNDFLQLICTGCLVRLELIKSIERGFVNADILFHKLVGIALEHVAEIKPITEALPAPTADMENSIIESDASFDEEHISAEWLPPEPVVDIVMNKSTAGIKKRGSRLTRRGGSKRSKHQKQPELSLREIMGRKCYICSVFLESANELASHLTEKHSNMKVNRCEECSRDFPMVSAYNSHLARHDRTERPDKCTFCPLRFKGRSGQMIHENKKHGTNHQVVAFSEKKDPVICDACGESFMYKSMLRSHYRRKHNTRKEKPKCKICYRTFTTNGSLLRHMQIHIETKPYNCDECDASFRRLLYLKQHTQKVHEGNNPYVCTECKQDFTSAVLLYKHKRIVHQKNMPALKVDPERFKYFIPCGICNEVYYKSSELQQHIAMVHADVDYPYFECAQCPRKYLSKQSLACHKAAHSDRSVCKECGKRFGSVQAVKIHIASVHEKQQYNCNLCPTKTFKSLAALRNHMTLHTRGKPHACDFCDKHFARKDQLTIHRRTHTGEKPHECPSCSKRFSDGATFHKHKKRCQEMKQEG